MEESPPSGPPRTVTVKDASSDTIHLRWTPPAEEDQNGRITGYVLDYSSHRGNGSLVVSSTGYSLPAYPYTRYELKVAAVNSAGQGPFSEVVATATFEDAPSSPPTEVTVMEKGSSYVLLHWIAPPESTHNGIIRHYLVRLNSSESLINHASFSFHPSISIGSLQPYTEYTCSVAAVTVSAGPFSKNISFTTDPHVPGSVQSLAAVALSTRSMKVSWLPPLDGDRTRQIIDYQINVTLIRGPGEDRYTTTTGSTSVLVRSLHPNYLYQCSVTSRTSAGPGPLNHVLIQLPPDVPTGYPQNIYAIPSDPTTLHLYWSPPPPDEQNGDLMQYGVKITGVEEGEATQYYNTSGPITSFVVHNLHPFSVYQYTVTAFTTVGSGPYSPANTIQMISAPPSSAPFNLSLDEIGSSYALLQWEPPPEGDRNGVIEHFQVHLNNSRGLALIFGTAGPQIRLLLHSLQPSTQYVCTVTAVTVSPGPASTPIRFTTNSSVPGTVQFLTATALSPRSANISWEPPLNSRETSLDYSVTITPLYKSLRGPQLFLTSSTSLVVADLQPGAYYLCTVAAMTRTGQQHSVQIILMEQPPDVPEGAPRNIKVFAEGSRSLHFIWSPPPLQERNGDIVRYGVNLTEVETGEVTQYLTRDSSVSFTIPHLHPHYHYNYSLTAFTFVGHGPYSPTYSEQMPEDVPDASPVNITVANLNPGSVALHWLPPPLEKCNGHVTGYTIKTVDGLTPDKDREIDNLTSHTMGSLNFEHHYEFAVAARTKVGHGPFSAPSPIVTLPGAPSAPVGVSAARLSATQMSVSWPKDQAHSWRILHFTVKYSALSSDSRSRREVDAQLVDTKTNITIHNLEPATMYGVAVAANSASGMGEFSDEIIVGFSENILFQLFVEGAIDCQEWVLHHLDAKIKSAKDSLSLELEKSCQCQFSADYLLFHRPRCLSAHTDWLILWGRIVGTNHMASTAILGRLQDWTSEESKMVVKGVHLTTLEFCTVSLSEGELPFCEIPIPTPMDTGIDVPTPQSLVTYGVVGAVTLMFVIILVILVCLITVSLCKKKRLKNRQQRFHADNPLEEYDMPPLPHNAGARGHRNDDVYVIYDEADSLYESIPDNEVPVGGRPAQPPPLPNCPIPTRSNDTPSHSSAGTQKTAGDEESESYLEMSSPINAHPYSVPVSPPIPIGAVPPVTVETQAYSVPVGPPVPLGDTTPPSSTPHEAGQPPAETPTPNEPGTEGTLVSPYQSLLREPEVNRYQRLQPTPAGSSQGHTSPDDRPARDDAVDILGQVKPSNDPKLRSSYKLLGIRDKENEYQIVQSQNGVQERDGQAGVDPHSQ
jgi:hypothetical protein